MNGADDSFCIVRTQGLFQEESQWENQIASMWKTGLFNNNRMQNKNKALIVSHEHRTAKAIKKCSALTYSRIKKKLADGKKKKDAYRGRTDTNQIFAIFLRPNRKFSKSGCYRSKANELGKSIK